MNSQLKDDVQWSSEQKANGSDERRAGMDRRQYTGRSITVPDMRKGMDRRLGTPTKGKVRLTITGRAMDI